MKKLSFLILLFFCVVGCTQKPKLEELIFPHCQKIIIMDIASRKYKMTITDQKKIDSFVQSIYLPNWKEQNLPKDAEQRYQYDIYYGEKGEKKASIITYNLLFATIKVNGLSFTARIPNKVYATLNSVGRSS